MNSYDELVQSIFGEIMKTYKLVVVHIDGNEVSLVGDGFALSISINREGVEIYYIMPDSKAQLVQYRLSNSLQDKFTNIDRSHYGNPITNEERIISELKVFASGLFNHWGDLLSGDKTWIKKYKGREVKTNAIITSKLAPVFANKK